MDDIRLECLALEIKDKKKMDGRVRATKVLKRNRRRFLEEKLSSMKPFIDYCKDLESPFTYRIDKNGLSVTILSYNIPVVAISSYEATSNRSTPESILRFKYNIVEIAQATRTASYVKAVWLPTDWMRDEHVPDVAIKSVDMAKKEVAKALAQFFYVDSVKSLKGISIPTDAKAHVTVFATDF